MESGGKVPILSRQASRRAYHGAMDALEKLSLEIQQKQAEERRAAEEAAAAEEAGGGAAAVGGGE